MIGQTVSHYKILEKLGGGGMGVVYKAEDNKLKRTVALKFLPFTFSADSDAKQRFIHEAQAASALQHNNICTIHDIDETDDGQLFIVMDCYEGETLKERIERGQLAIETITDYALQVAQGLAEAHKHGIVHRDIKPANILITNGGVVKILDFGLAKLQGQSKVTRTGSTVGTVAYMSPEQVLGQDSDHRTDIWSFGVMLYEMLTQRLPFRGEMSAAIMYAITFLEPEQFRNEERDIPVNLKELTLACLRKAKEERPQSFHDATCRITGGSVPTYPWRVSQRKQARPWTLIGSMLLGLGICIYFAIRYDFLGGSQALKPADFVLVADFQNKTDQSLFDYSLTKAMIVSLQQSKHVRLLARDRVTYALQLLRMSTDKPLDVTTALAVAKREGVRMVIAGTITTLGATYALTFEIIDVVTGATVKLLRRDARRTEDILPTLGELCDELRSNLGESLSQISKASRPLAGVTSSSIEALHLYGRADQYQSQGKYAESAVLLEKAVSIDSLFTIAISDLSYAYRKTGRDSLALAYHRKVLPLIDRVTDRERAIALGLYYGPFFELEFQKAYESIQTGLVLAPDDPMILATVGHLAMFVGDTRAALRANDEATRISPDYAGSCYNNSGFALAQDQRHQEALEYFGKSKSLRPDYLSIDMYISKVHWMKGDLDSAANTLLSLLPIDDPFSANQIHSLLASLYYYQGQIKQSKAECLSALSSARRLRRPTDESYFRYLLAEIAVEEGDKQEYLRQIWKSINTCNSPYFELGLAGASLARNGMVGDAEKVLSMIAAVKSQDPYFTKRRDTFENLTKGEIEMSRRNFAKAKNHFETIERRHASDILYWMGQRGLAVTMILLGDTAVTSILQNILSRKGEIIMGTLTSVRFGGFWTRWLLPDIQIELAKLYIREGKVDKAQYELTQCLQLWKNADRSFTRAQKAGLLFSQIVQHKPVHNQ